MYNKLDNIAKKKTFTVIQDLFILQQSFVSLRVYFAVMPSSLYLLIHVEPLNLKINK